MTIITEKLTILTAGSNGSAVGETLSSPITGVILAVKVNYDATAPATTDFTGIEQGGLEQTVVTLTNNATDITVYPVPAATTNAGVATGGYLSGYFIGGSRVLFSIAGCNALTAAAVVTVQWQSL